MRDGPTCRLCGAQTTGAFAVADLNRRVTGDEFHYVRCTACGIVGLADVPPDLGRHYAGGYHRIPAAADLPGLADDERYKLELVTRFASSGRLLDVGASQGAFLWLAREAGFDAAGIEMDAECCEFLAGLGFDVTRSSEPERALLDGPARDVITAWHVIEHVPDPWALLGAIARRLVPGGIAVIATPNPDGLQFRRLGRHWPHVDAPRHLQLVPPAEMARRAEAAGLEVLLLTGDDPGSRRCNRFGWEWGLRHAFEARTGRRPATMPLAPIVSRLCAPFERGLRGASGYTAVMRRP